MKKVLCIILLFLNIPVLAWEGYDYDRNTYIEIEKGNLVRRGRDIEVFDYSNGQYKTYEVENIKNSYSGRHTEVEVYDWNNNEYRTFEMDNY